RAEREYDLEKVAKLKYGTLAQLERDLAAEEGKHAAKNGGRLLKDEVDEKDLAQPVSRRTGGPPSPPARSDHAQLPPPTPASHLAPSATTTPSPRWRTPSCVPGPASRIPTAPSGRSSSSARPAWGRPSSPAPSPSSSSTANRR